MPAARAGSIRCPSCSALACAANVGSAATLIGNPQNMLIGETLQLSFAGYFAQALRAGAARPAGDLGADRLADTRPLGCLDADARRTAAPDRRADDASLDRWQTAKGLAVAAALLSVFLFQPAWPRDVVALTGAGLLLTSRKLHSRKMLGLVDWELLVLFIGLFVVNHALQKTGIAAGAVADLAAAGVTLEQPGAAVRRDASCCPTSSPTCRR